MKNKIQQLITEDKTQEAKQLIFSLIAAQSHITEGSVASTENDKVGSVPVHDLYLLLGSAYAIESNNELAIQYFNKAYEIAPDNFDVILTISNFFITNGSNTEANQLVDNYLKQANARDTSGAENKGLLNGLNQAEDNFNYMEFIIGGGDAINYVPKTSVAAQPAVSTESAKDAFSYMDFIVGGEDAVNYSTKAEITDSKSLPRLLFTMYGWNESGGGTLLPRALTKELAKRGYEVAVFYATANHSTVTMPYFMEKTVEDNVTLYGVYNRPTVFLDIDNPLREICDNNVIHLFSNVIDEFKPDIVNFHNFLGLSFEMASITKKRNIVSTFTPHNYHLIDPKLYLINNDLNNWKSTNFFENSDLVARFPALREGFAKRIEKAQNLILNEIDYIFAVSCRVKELLVEFSGNSAVAINKICVINQVNSAITNLISKSVDKLDSDKLRFAFIGTGLPYKGAHIIAQALQFIDTSLKFSINFWGEYTEGYANAIKALDKSNIISFKGAYTADDLQTIANDSDLMLFASLGEDCAPMVLAESLAMRLPVIAAKIGGVEDFIVDGYNGFLYTAGNPKALGSVIQMLLHNKFKIPKISANCHIPYTFHEYVSHLESIYIKLFKDKRPDINEFNLLFSNSKSFVS